MNLKHYSSAQGVLLKIRPTPVFVTAFFYLSTVTSLMRRTFKSIRQLLHFPSEVQFHIVNCLLDSTKTSNSTCSNRMHHLSFNSTSNIWFLNQNYLFNEWYYQISYWPKQNARSIIPLSSTIQSTPSICILNRLSYGGGWYRMCILMMSQHKA